MSTLMIIFLFWVSPLSSYSQTEGKKAKPVPNADQNPSKSKLNLKKLAKKLDKRRNEKSKWSAPKAPEGPEQDVFEPPQAKPSPDERNPKIQSSAEEAPEQPKNVLDPKAEQIKPVPMTASEAAKELVEDIEEINLIDEIIEESLEERFIENNIAISAFFDEVADGLDTFLIGKRITTRKNETSVKVQNSTYVMADENTQNNTSIGVNLRLPNVEEYWQLKFTSYDDSDERRGVQKGYLRNTPREQNYGATIGLFRKLGNVRTSFQPRIDLGDPLKVSHSLTFESVADLKTYSVNPKLELFADPSDGAGAYVALNVNFRIDKIYSLTLVNNGEYNERKHVFITANGFSVGQILDRFASLSYSLIFSGVNQPNHHLEAYSLSVAWSQLIYRRILDFQLIPHLDFPREKGFVGKPGVIFNLNLNF